jgi:hypothetical protein
MKQPDELILKKLHSQNIDTVIATVEQLHETGTSIYIPALIDLFFTVEDPSIKNSVRNLLAELKQADAIPYLLDAIGNERYQPIKRELISICWENGLDFTPHIGNFIGWMKQGDYMTAFEAFTVIENLEGKITEEEADRYIAELMSAMESSPSPEKAALFHDLIHFISSLPE